LKNAGQFGHLLADGRVCRQASHEVVVVTHLVMSPIDLLRQHLCPQLGFGRIWLA
jgi:hypothetical protein